MHDDEMWLVKLDDGRVRSMTLDELDASYQRGEIHERTMICRDGGDRWITLADELGEAESAPPPPPDATPSTPPVVADLGDDHHPSFASSRKGTRVVAILLGVVVLGAFGAFAAITAVNASRTRARAALAAQLMAEAAAAHAHDNDPEPEATAPAMDPAQPRAVQHRNKKHVTGNAAPRTWEDKPASTVFTNGGDEHDPLNAKL